MRINNLGFLAVAIVVSPGCSKTDPHGREPISGTVRFHGEPIPKANIMFINENGQTDFGGGSLILNGHYNMEREFGLPPGNYRARISLLDRPAGQLAKTPSFPGEEKAPVAKSQEMIPAPFSTEGVAVEVRAGAQNKFDFDIP